MTAVAHRASYRRPGWKKDAFAARTGIYRLTPHVGHAATELVIWLQAHAIPRSRVPDNATLIVGGGRLSIDYLLPTGSEQEAVRARIMVPLHTDRPVPSAFRMIEENEEA
jgi:hypothetical protein